MFEVLSIQARNKLARTMKAKSKMIAAKRKRAMSKKASPEKLKTRAQKKAVDFVVQKILKGKNRSELGQAGKASLEKKIKSKSVLIKKLAKKLLPQVKKAEAERMAKKKSK
jgi:hypothetical protein